MNRKKSERKRKSMKKVKENVHFTALPLAPVVSLLADMFCVFSACSAIFALCAIGKAIEKEKQKE